MGTPSPKSRKRTRSPSPPKALREDDFEVASTGPIQQDVDLHISKWALTRGGIRQRMKAASDFEAFKVRRDQERQLREAAQIGSKALVQNILTELQKRAHDGNL